MATARADHASVVAALAVRRLDRTLTTSLAPFDPLDEFSIGPIGLAALDARLGGGFPRGHLSELVGRRSSGRTSVMLQAMAAATGRGELVALVDALDMFDVESAVAAGVDLERLLWIRGHVVSNPGFCRDMNQRALEQAIRALTLVLQAGSIGLVVFDVGEAPADALRRLPFTTWLRLQRMVEGRQTVCVLVGNEPMARSSAGLTVLLGRAGPSPRQPGGRGYGEVAPPFDGAQGGLSEVERPKLGPEAARAKAEQAGQARFSGRSFDGLDVAARVVRARTHLNEDAVVTFPTAACHA